MKRRKLLKIIAGMGLIGILNNNCEDEEDEKLLTSPLFIPNCRSWYDFTDPLNTTIDPGDLYSQVVDKGLSGDNANAAGAARPAYIPNSLNGWPVARFNGAGNVMTNVGQNYGASYTIFIVGNHSPATQCIMGNVVGNSLLENGSYFWGIRTTGGVTLGCEKFYPNNQTLAATERSYMTVRSNAGSPSCWIRKNRRSWNVDPVMGTLILKDIGGFAGFWYNKDIAEIIIYNRSLTNSEISQIHNYIEHKYNMPTQFILNPTNRITFLGNSFTDNPVYPYLVFNNLNNVSLNWIQSRWGQGGATTPQVITAGVVYFNQRVSNPVTGYDFVIVWEGTNHIVGGATAIQAEASLASLCGTLTAAGFQVIICTILPRNIVGFDAIRLAANVLIRTNWAGYAAAIADVGDDDEMGDSGDELDLTYYEADGTHPNTNGYNHLVTEWIQPAVNSLL